MMKWEMEICPPSMYLSSPTNWTHEENKIFENALAYYDTETPDRWHKVAAMIPGKTAVDVFRHYQDLEEDVSVIEAGLVAVPSYSPSSFTLGWVSDNNHGFDGLKQSYGSGAKRSSAKSSDQERKKGVPWTEEEHKLFLMGLNTHGKGDWRNISRNFVQSRTPAQVASHAQKYFIRLSSGGKDKRRSSIHDITTVNLTDKRPPSTARSSPVSTQLNSIPAAMKPSNHFSILFDSDQTNEGPVILSSMASQTQGNLLRSPSSYAVTPYGIKLQTQNLHRNSFRESHVGGQGMLFQLQSLNHLCHG